LIDDGTGGRDEPKRPIAPRRRGLGKGLGAILPSPGQPSEQPSPRDQLTGLPNRSVLDERFEEAVARCREDGALLAVFVVALDGFGEVNEEFGHRVGDELLHDAATRLAAARRTSDTVARFAGDEFVVVCPYVESVDIACRMAQRILEDLSRPASVDGVEHQLSASIGVVVSSPGAVAGAVAGTAAGTKAGSSRDTTGNEQSLETLLGHASLAMRHAKDGGGASWQLFDPTMRDEVVVRSQSRQDLRAAMEDGGLVLVYEPIVDVETGAVIGESAQLGWREPSPDADQPQALLDLADEAGLAGPIGRWVLDQALGDLSARSGRSNLPEQFRVWVKVAPSLVADPAFAGTVDELTAKHQMAASMLGLDIREPSAAALASTEATLHVLEERDVVVAIDDFGAGPSNLALLQRLPITGLKLAPEIVAGVVDPAASHPSSAAVVRDRPVAAGSDSAPASSDRPAAASSDRPAGREGAALVRALIELGHALDLTVVAQGVESEAQLVALRALGCGYAQGPLFARGAPTAVARQRQSLPESQLQPGPQPESPKAEETGIDAIPAAEASTATQQESLWAPGTTPGGGVPGS
jgi:diguanylate cyclase (GGDEF)-like protein